MTTASSPAIAILATGRYRAEALALSMAAHSDQEIVPLIEPESSVLARCSIILVELDTTLESALELIRCVGTHYPDSAVVVLGLLETEENIVKVAEAGACGYVPANASLPEMISIVQSARKGEFSCSPHCTHMLFCRLAALARSRDLFLLRGSGLTTRERQIMELLAEYLSNREIANRLCVAECTVKNHVHHILRKLGVRSRNVAGRLPPPPLLTAWVPLRRSDQPRSVAGASKTVRSVSGNSQERSA